jgi:N-acetylmuramoyl-L-alanine amidase
LSVIAAVAAVGLTIACALMLGSADPNSCEASPFVIAIDVGHSAADPGASSARGGREFDFNRRIADLVLERLRAAGITNAFLVNPTGGPISLADRARIANDRGAELFLSIHHDSVQPRYLQQWTVDGRSRAYSDRFAGYSLFVTGTNDDRANRSLEVATTVGDEFRRAGLRPSLHHAEKIPGEGRDLLDPERGIYGFPELAVLRRTKMPALLVECGVIVNRNEETRLGTAAEQAKLADTLSRALIAVSRRWQAADAPAFARACVDRPLP